MRNRLYLTISEIRALGRKQRRQERTWNQIITGLRKRPDVCQAICRLPPIQRFLKMGQKVLPCSAVSYVKRQLIEQPTADQDFVMNAHFPNDNQITL